MKAKCRYDKDCPFLKNYRFSFFFSSHCHEAEMEESQGCLHKAQEISERLHVWHSNDQTRGICACKGALFPHSCHGYEAVSYSNYESLQV